MFFVLGIPCPSFSKQNWLSFISCNMFDTWGTSSIICEAPTSVSTQNDWQSTSNLLNMFNVEKTRNIPRSKAHLNTTSSTTISIRSPQKAQLQAQSYRKVSKRSYTSFSWNYFYWFWTRSTSKKPHGHVGHVTCARKVRRTVESICPSLDTIRNRIPVGPPGVVVVLSSLSSLLLLLLSLVVVVLSYSSSSCCCCYCCCWWDWFLLFFLLLVTVLVLVLVLLNDVWRSLGTWNTNPTNKYQTWV